MTLIAANYGVIDLKRVRRIACDPVEGIPVGDLQMLPVPAFDNAARGQAPQCSAHGLTRHSEIFPIIRPFHREIYLGRTFVSDALKVFQSCADALGRTHTSADRC